MQPYVREVEVVFLSLVIKYSEKTPVQRDKIYFWTTASDVKNAVEQFLPGQLEIGRASCRERV